MSKKFRDNIYTYSNGSQTDWIGMLLATLIGTMVGIVISLIVVGI